jgi:citrate synthase
MATNGPTTALCSHTKDAIYVRGSSLTEELVGQLSFTQMIYLHLLGRRAQERETKVLDAVLITLMEHGFTPSAIAARLVYSSAPEAPQAAVAAGVLAVGSQFVGTMEDAARLLDQITAAENPQAEAERIVEAHRTLRKKVPGFGHHLHTPDDPRTPRLFKLAGEAGVPGKHIAAVELLAKAVDRAAGRHLTPNATAACAALLREIEIPTGAIRGIAVISRAAGLVGHVLEEQQQPTLRHIWSLVDETIPYAAQKED